MIAMHGHYHCHLWPFIIARMAYYLLQLVLPEWPIIIASLWPLALPCMAISILPEWPYYYCHP